MRAAWSAPRGRHGWQGAVLCLLLVAALFLGACADRGVEIKPRGQMVIGGGVSGGTVK